MYLLTGRAYPVGAVTPRSPEEPAHGWGPFTSDPNGFMWEHTKYCFKHPLQCTKKEAENGPNFVAAAGANILGLDEGDGGMMDFDGVFMMLIKKHMSAAYVNIKVLEEVDMAFQYEILSQFGLSFAGGVDIYPEGVVMPFFSYAFDVNDLKLKFDVNVDELRKGKFKDIAKDYVPGKEKDGNPWKGPPTKHPNPQLQDRKSGNPYYDYTKSGWSWDKDQKRYTYTEKTAPGNGVRKPSAYTGPDKPSLTKNGFGVYPIEMAPLSVMLEAGFRGGLVMKFPGFAVKLPKDTEWTFDLLDENKLRHTAKPNITLLHGELELTDPSVFLNVMAGPKMSWTLGHNFMQALPQNLQPTIGMGLRGDVARVDWSLFEKTGVDGSCKPLPKDSEPKDVKPEGDKGGNSSEPTNGKPSPSSVSANDIPEGGDIVLSTSSVAPTATRKPFPDFGNGFPGNDDSPGWNSAKSGWQPLWTTTSTLYSDWTPQPTPEACLPFPPGPPGQGHGDVVPSPENVCITECDDSTRRLTYVWLKDRLGGKEVPTQGGWIELAPGLSCAALTAAGPYPVGQPPTVTANSLQTGQPLGYEDHTSVEWWEDENGVEHTSTSIWTVQLYSSPTTDPGASSPPDGEILQNTIEEPVPTKVFPTTGERQSSGESSPMAEATPLQNGIAWPTGLAPDSLPLPDGSGGFVGPDTVTLTGYDPKTGAYTYDLKSDRKQHYGFVVNPEGSKAPQVYIQEDGSIVPPSPPSQSPGISSPEVSVRIRGEDGRTASTKTFGVTGVFRTGVYLYAQCFAVAVDSSWLGQLDNKPEGTRGLYWSKQIIGKCWECEGHCVSDFVNKAVAKVVNEAQELVDVVLQNGTEAFNMLGRDSEQDIWGERLSEGDKMGYDREIVKEVTGKEWDGERSEVGPNQQWKRMAGEGYEDEEEET